MAERPDHGCQARLRRSAGALSAAAIAAGALLCLIVAPALAMPARAALETAPRAGLPLSSRAALATHAQAALPALAGGAGFRLHRGLGGESDVNVCSYLLPRGLAHCDVHLRTDSAAGARHPLRAAATRPLVIGDEGAYSPAYLQSAYDVASAAAADGGGAGQIVAIVDAYDDPRAESDLAQYRSFFGLPACAAGSVSHAVSSCVFEKVSQTGSRTSYPAANSSWSVEISLDVDMVSAICPKCQVLLVEANNSSFTNLGSAVDEAVKLGADVVSNSYGGEEFSEEGSASSAYYEHAGVAVVASAGDEGYGVEFPAASRFVTAVGGTTLKQLTATGTRNGSETVWKGTGAGCSAYEPKPAWQHDSGCPRRTVADVSAVANPETGVWIYDSYGVNYNSWRVVGGTSVAAPIISSFYALAGNALSSSATLSAYPYAAPAALYDVTSGSDGSCSPSYLCTAGVGYDGPTGLGTPGTPNSIAAFSGAPPTPTVPTAPTNLLASAGNASVRLSWSASTGSGPITYSVYRSTKSAREGFALLGSGLTGTSFGDEGLTNGVTYYYKVAASNSIGEGEASEVVSATPQSASAPGQPRNVKATPSLAGITLTWSAPASNGGSAITSYEVYRATVSGGEAEYASVSCSASTCSYQDSGARTFGKTYYYEIAAVNGIGTGERSGQIAAIAF